MNLAQRIVQLADRVGQEVKHKVDADHPSLARAWATLDSSSGEVRLCTGYNVSRVERTASSQYRLRFLTPVADARYVVGITLHPLSGGCLGRLRAGSVRVLHLDATEFAFVWRAWLPGLPVRGQLHLVVYR